MTSIRHILATLALVLAAMPACTFGVLPHDPRDPALAAVPPCYAGDVCAVPFTGAGFGWAHDAIQSAR